MKIRTTVIVRGRVQGVAFRHHTTLAAQRQGVTGWVRNLSDGSVQACFEGEQDDVQAMVDWCRRGPDTAQVEQVVEEAGAYTGEFAGFSTRHGND